VNQPRQTLNQQVGQGNVLAPGGKRILVIEDDPDISQLLEINLRDSAFRVDVVNNGIEGLKRAGKQVYQLIVPISRRDSERKMMMKPLPAAAC